ncbi:hypothetical protein FACS189446_0790 [Bacteroidia bacterium]|nr:hypothetical protein FACS189446_0790 [Bacteroidia bacterium]
MSREELRTKIYHLILNIENDNVLQEILLFLESSSENVVEIIPGLPRTLEEKLASVEQGMKEYEQGLCITHEEFLKEQETWGFVGNLAQEKQ